MNWVKELWNQFFVSDDEPVQESGNREEAAETKPPFRFPLISDEELYGEELYSFSRPEPKEPEFQQPGPNIPQSSADPVRLVKLPKPEKKTSSAVYEPARPAAVQEPARPVITPITEKKKPVPNSRYKPSRVPSPVHGFQPRTDQKPAPIEDLLEEKDQYQSEQVYFSQQPILSSEEELRMEVPHSEEMLLEKQESEPMEVVADREELSQVPKISEMDEENIHTEEKEPRLTAEQAVAETREQDTEKKQPSEVPVSAPPSAADRNPREKVVPFNVIMLKSDRERLKTSHLPIKDEQVKEEPMKEEPVRPVNTQRELPSRPKRYVLPDHRLLLAPEHNNKDEQWMAQQGQRLVEALSHFQVKSEIIDIMQGPAVTQFELKVANGVKVSKIRNLADDLKLALAAKDIRIQAPIPGKSSIGIEIPNRTSRPVRISEIIESEEFQSADSPLEAVLGLDLTGRPVTVDLRKMPHGLIAGATGSGKSVCINSLLISLLYKASPEDLKLLLIDPKMVELAPYNNIPHLISPVITDVKAATASLKWAVEEMERRYQLFAHAGVRDISRFNKLVEEKGNYVQKLPYIMIVIDELADLMMMAPADVEDAICRIAQKARACGIHLIIATQRPSVDVITGLIKANVPTRIAFSVSSQVDSRTILDTQGAERLLGRGDMLYQGNGMPAPLRLQGTYVTDEEIEEVIAHVRLQGTPDYLFKEDELIRTAALPDAQDDLFEEACRFILSQGSASTSLLQRKFHIGYNRAARLMDLIEQHGFVSEQNGSKARDVLLTEEELEEIF